LKPSAETYVLAPASTYIPSPKAISQKSARGNVFAVQLVPSDEYIILSDSPTTTNWPLRNRTRFSFPYAPAVLVVHVIPSVERATKELSPTATNVPFPYAMLLSAEFGVGTVRRTQESSGCCAMTWLEMLSRARTPAKVVWNGRGVAFIGKTRWLE